MIDYIRPTYYYIIAVVKGKRFIDGAYATREEACKMAWRNLQGVVWDIIESPYRDRAKVVQHLKHKLWEKTGDIEEATQPMRHKL